MWSGSSFTELNASNLRQKVGDSTGNDDFDVEVERCRRSPVDNQNITHLVLMLGLLPTLTLTALPYTKLESASFWLKPFAQTSYTNIYSFWGVFALTGNGRPGPILTKLGGRVEESLLNLMAF